MNVNGKKSKVQIIKAHKCKTKHYGNANCN